jgi:GGDEF domain-containing protein
VVLRDAPDDAEVVVLAERIRLRLSTPISDGATTAVVGVSVGVSRAPLASLDVDALVQSADEQMYAHKPAH